MWASLKGVVLGRPRSDKDPRVFQGLSRRSTDSWLPHRFAQLSDRLTAQNGVLLMSGAALLALWYTRGNYRAVQAKLKRLAAMVPALPPAPAGPPPPLDPQAPTAVLFVGPYMGLGVHSLLAIQQLFPNVFKHFTSSPRSA